jgi:hypothetical protein
MIRIIRVRLRYTSALDIERGENSEQTPQL